MLNECLLISDNLSPLSSVKAIFEGLILVYLAAPPTAEVGLFETSLDVCLLSISQSLNKASKKTYSWATAHSQFYLQQINRAVSTPGFSGRIHESLIAASRRISLSTKREQTHFVSGREVMLASKNQAGTGLRDCTSIMRRHLQFPSTNTASRYIFY
jgi:hypothetical protein